MSSQTKPLEVVVDDRPACPHCGEPMNAGVAIVCGPGGSGGTLELPATCVSRECRKARDAAAIERAIASGLIDP